MVLNYKCFNNSNTILILLKPILFQKIEILMIFDDMHYILYDKNKCLVENEI